MDTQIADIFEAAVYSAGAIGIAYTIARHWYQKRKSDNETFAERTKATQELLSDPNYKEYLQRREDIADKLLQNDPSLVEFGRSDAIKCRIDAIVGDFH